MWDLILSVPHHCLSFYFESHLSKYMAENDTQYWWMTMFQKQIVSQPKINDYY